MKKLLILLLISATAFSQGGALRFTVLQDVKLATMKDDHGNTPFTADVIAKLHFQEFDFGQNYGFPVVGVKYEYADLSSGNLNRYGVEAGYSIPFLKVKDGSFNHRPFLTVTPLVSWGILKREQIQTREYWEFVLDTSVNITKHLSLVGSNSYLLRRDYKTPFWRWSVHFGFAYEL